MKIKYYLNLTNGIEFLNYADLCEHDIGFIRIQSTACEQKRWEFILNDLDYDFLLNLALGRMCVVVDYSNKNNNKKCRAVWQGLEWIKFVLFRVWFNVDCIVFVAGKECTKYFNEQYRKLDRKTTTRLKYFKKFLITNPATNSIRIYHFTEKTENDGNYDYFRKVLEEKYVDR